MDIAKQAERARAQLKSVQSEARGADSGSSPETTKTKGKTSLEQKPKDDDQNTGTPPAATKPDDKKPNIEAEAKRDEEILGKPDDQLTGDEKDRKAVLLKKKAETEEKDNKSNVQKRFDQLSSQIKALEHDRNVTKEQRDALQQELDEIKRQLSMTPQDKTNEKIKGELATRQKKYLDEDKDLPREERREMSKEELDEWALEDYEGAQEWITKRTIRRSDEEKTVRDEEIGKVGAEGLAKKQRDSASKVYATHPELDITKRVEELRKSGQDQKQIQETILAENPKLRTFLKICQENPETYMGKENGPELIAAEMEKRLSNAHESSAGDDKLKKLEEEIAALKAENARLQNIDDDITSTRGSGPANPPEKPTELETERSRIARKVGLDPAAVSARAKLRKEQGYDD